MKRNLSIGIFVCAIILLSVWGIAASKVPEKRIVYKIPNTAVGIPIASKVTTDANGLITVTYQNSYTVTPNVQANIANGAVNSRQYIRIYNNTAAGFTCQVYQFNTVNLLSTDLLLGTNVPVSGAVVDFLITAMQ